MFKLNLLEIIKNLQIFFTLYWGILLAFMSSVYLLMIDAVNTLSAFSYNPVWWNEIPDKIIKLIKTQIKKGTK